MTAMHVFKLVVCLHFRAIALLHFRALLCVVAMARYSFKSASGSKLRTTKPEFGLDHIQLAYPVGKPHVRSPPLHGGELLFRIQFFSVVPRLFYVFVHI